MFLSLNFWLICLPSLWKLFNPSAIVDWNGSSLLGAWGRGSRALQETARVPGTIILQSSGQNKVGEASGPKRRRNRPIPSWENLEVPLDAYSPSLLPAWKTSRKSKQ